MFLIRTLQIAGLAVAIVALAASAPHWVYVLSLAVHLAGDLLLLKRLGL